MILTGSYSRVASSFMDANVAMKLLGIKGTGDFAKDRKVILKLAKEFHSDVNPDKEAERKMLAVNALLSQFIQEKEPLPTGSTRPRQPSYPQRSESNDLPPWQTDFRSSYNDFREGDFRNINFCMKYIYEHALQAEGGDRSRLERITLWSFDGVYSRGVMTVFGSPKIDQAMSDVMRRWQSSTEAVVATDKSGDCRVIWVGGHDVNIPVEHESFNKNPFNDKGFEKEMRDIVNQYK